LGRVTTNRRINPAAPPGTKTQDSEFVTLDRQRAVSGFDWGLAAMLVVAVLYGFLLYPIGLTWGLIAIGIGGGWIIGKAVSHGAWRGLPHPRNWSLRILAVVLSLVGWVLGMFVSYVMSQVLLEGAALPLLERLSGIGFSEYMTQTYDVFHGIAMGALAIMAWRTAG
jgi:hypothetical protein